MSSLLILGRQPAVALAELESLYGAKAVTAVKPFAALLDVEPKDVDFRRLGGSIKLCKVLTELPTTEWREIEKYLAKTIPENLHYLPEGKFRLGLSTYGLRARPFDINATGLRLKKIIKAAGRSVRVVPNKAPELNSAQVLHNQLTGPTGWELVCYRNGSKTILAQTTDEQDIEAYAARDQSRPMRDAKVGMLPPKLAQIILNLATGQIRGGEQREESRVTSGPRLLPSALVLDPFCGTGVVLQEALLMGYSVYGTDIEERMVEYSRENLAWLEQKTGRSYNVQLETGDATSHLWDPRPAFVAAETYLGKPLSKEPDETLLRKIMHECDDIHVRALQNLGKQLKAGTRLCLAVPAWKFKGGFKHLQTLDHLKKLGYTRMSFVHTSNEDLLYYRPDQYVARELVVLTKD